MNRNETRAAILIMEAYIDGYEIQRCGKQWNPRESLKPDWCDTDDPCWDFDSCYYRRKPTATLRPWTADEVPLGAWMRVKDSNCGHRRVLICGTYDEPTRSTWLSTSEHSTDGGVTWKPCGVVEEAK
jgi:hypothetical protein